MPAWLQVLWAFTKIGLLGFGGGPASVAISIFNIHPGLAVIGAGIVGVLLSRFGTI